MQGAAPPLGLVDWTQEREEGEEWIGPSWVTIGNIDQV